MDRRGVSRALRTELACSLWRGSPDIDGDAGLIIGAALAGYLGRRSPGVEGGANLVLRG